MNIGKIILWLLNKSASHTCTEAHGAQRRNYWFHIQGIGGGFARIYQGTEDTEALHNRGIYPMSQFATDNVDLTHPQALDHFRVELKTVEQLEQEAAAAAIEATRADEARAHMERELALIEKKKAALAEQHRAIEQHGAAALEPEPEAAPPAEEEGDAPPAAPAPDEPPTSRPASKRRLPGQAKA